MIDIDVVIPTYNGYSEIRKLVESFKLQKNINIRKIVLPITRSNFGNDYNLEQYCIKNSIIYFFVEKNDFSHSLIRERAIIEFCTSNLIILMTQDAKLYNSLSMFNLVKDINPNNIVYTFGRQVCSKKRCLENYIRSYNYPSETYIADKSRIYTHQIKAFFASDVFAGLNRDVFIKLKGYDSINVSTNEDMLYMYKIIMNDFKAKYCADAVVEHFHECSYKELYKRYYNVGLFFKKNTCFKKYNKNKSGGKMAFYVLREILKKIDIVSLIKWFPNMFIRYIAFKNGGK